MPVEHPDPAAFKAWLAARAREAGFARVGFASCEPFDAERPRLESWLAAGRAALLPYLHAGIADPATVMPGARTALVGFFPYARPDAVPGAAPGSLKLSRYLWGEDYHLILKPRLQRILEAAQTEWPGLQGRVCVDTAPIMERQMAARAGLGWQGRHTLLIAGKGGSWGFLGILLLDAALPPDRPFEGHHCGTCTRCLDACPTGALAPFSLDPALCMTTYTVETEAEPPAAVARAIADTGWVAGCDLCQEVCPWNRAPLWGNPALWGAPDRLHELPAGELAMGAAQWRKRTKRRPLRRVRHRHWLATLRRAGVAVPEGLPGGDEEGAE